MAKFGVTANKGAAVVKTVLGLNAAAANMRRSKIYELAAGSDATPASQQFVIIGQRSTTLPTGATLTPNALDPADTAAATTVATDTVTVDPALTAAAFPFPGMGLNQNATYRWVAREGSEIVIPAVANAGIAFGVKAAVATSFQFGASFEEQ